MSHSAATANKSNDDFLQLSVVHSISEIDTQDWNRNIPSDCPFLRHEFLRALEDTGCVSEHTGWIPIHIVIRNTQGRNASTVAVTPMYLKNHSHGEFIFDWQWASAYHRAGQRYYPKIVIQAPFTPLSAPKLLMSDEINRERIMEKLIIASHKLADQCAASSIHWLFVPYEEMRVLKQNGLIERCSTYEYVWNNPGYSSMEDFLSTLMRRKRKKIRQERKSVSSQGVSLEAISGDDIQDRHWEIFDRFYRRTVNKYHSNRYLNKDFFHQIGESMSENLVLFLARISGEPIAGSLCLQGGGKLFGRYWGTLHDMPNLHFETCYYSAIEYCIENSIQTYNAGVQGEHKLSRGFLPSSAYSAHFIQHPAFAKAIGEHVEYEKTYYRSLEHELNASSAFSKPQ